MAHGTGPSGFAFGQLRALAAAALLAGLPSPLLSAGELVTSLVDIRQGSGLSELARSLTNGGYELQSGEWLSFEDWYRTDWPELYVDFLTQYAEDSGILWGFGTGERGEKYEIAPSLKLGFITQIHPQPNSTLALTATTTFFGEFSELPCEADYGVLGTYPVNCRLAASQLAPEETLQYLVKSEPARLTLSLSFRASF
jgi:hypothetical protein